MTSLIDIENISFHYGAGTEMRTILKNVSLNINKGEFVAIVGPNGGGKSTLVRHMNGLLLPSEGQVQVNGICSSEEANLPIIRRIVGMVFQNPDAQIFASIVEEDVAFGLENMGLSSYEIRQRVDAALSRLELDSYKKHPPNKLSGGQRQKVAIAGIIAMEPACIILDEPTSMLDPMGKKEVMECVMELNKKNDITIIYITHDMSEVLFADRVVAISEGELLFDGGSNRFFSDQQLIRDIGLYVPPIKEMLFDLGNSGYLLPENIKTVEELVHELCQLKSKM